jgi:hypothetical protein
MKTFVHDPGATLDYYIDWASWLGADTIVTSTWTITGGGTGLVIEDDSHTDTTSTVWVSGGTVNRNYTLTNHITTALSNPMPREEEGSIVLMVRQK